MAKKQSKSGGNRKHGRNSDACKTYTAAGLQEKHKKRRMRRHYLQHPADMQAVGLYEQTFGYVADISVVSMGVNTGRNMSARAVRKLARKHDPLWKRNRLELRDARRHSRRIAAEKAAEQARHQDKRPVVTVA